MKLKKRDKETLIVALSSILVVSFIAAVSTYFVQQSEAAENSAKQKVASVQHQNAKTIIWDDKTVSVPVLQGHHVMQRQQIR